MMYYILPTDDDITHHGILGQKWGRRNGPPYPLDGSDHSASEKKAGWRKSLKDASKAGLKSAVVGPYSGIADRAATKAWAKKQAKNQEKTNKRQKLMQDRIKYIEDNFSDMPETRDAMIRDIKKQFSTPTKSQLKKKLGKKIVDLNEKRMSDNERIRYDANISDNIMNQKIDSIDKQFTASAKKYLQDSGLLSKKVSDRKVNKTINKYYKIGQKEYKKEQSKLDKYFK